MECVNGEWIMTGCSSDDPDRLKSLDELVRDCQDIECSDGCITGCSSFFI